MHDAATFRRQRRKDKKLTLADLATSAGRTVGQLSRVEREGTDSISLARKLGAELDLPIEAFAKEGP
jgi:transcriptional regulator with XRE-family HTH domain